MAGHKQVIIDWIRNEIDGQDVVSPVELTERVVATFRDDDATLAWLVSGTLRPLIYTTVLQVARVTRRMPRYVEDGESRAATLARIEAGRRRWRERLEYAPSRAAHVRFTELRRVDLLSVIDRYRAEQERAARFLDYLTAILSRLPNDEATVGSVCTEAELDALYTHAMGGSVAHGHLQAAD